MGAEPSSRVRAVLDSIGLQLFVDEVPSVRFTALEALHFMESAYSQPVVSVKKSLPNAVEEVGEEWRRAAERAGLFTAEGKFFLLLASVEIDDAGWLCVKDPIGVNLPGRLLSRNGSIEFVAMSGNGKMVCSVTDEGDDYWVLSEEVQ
ncbi:hypothetical protein OG458_20560 [Streptomyces sp. NBC_01281]|uniref:hypothetical protein n=1 Tax=unclassified Streptomyces TaxID=2593676 RepID=UPI002E13D5A3|nr:hypothetical protein OG458_20560 [Streptomyces sp. NBC_01281]